MTTIPHDTPGGANGSPPVQVTQTAPTTTITPADVLAWLKGEVAGAGETLKRARDAQARAEANGHLAFADHHRGRVAHWAHRVAMLRATAGYVTTADPEG